MKAEKFLKKLGLSVNIVIVILLLVIVYYLYCINDNLSMERFSVGGQSDTERLQRYAAVSDPEFGIQDFYNTVGASTQGGGELSRKEAMARQIAAMGARSRGGAAGGLQTANGIAATPAPGTRSTQNQGAVNAGASCPDGQVRGPNGRCMTQAEIIAAGRAELNSQGINGGGVQTADGIAAAAADETGRQAQNQGAVRAGASCPDGQIRGPDGRCITR